MKKWKIKESAADKRPVFLIARGGVGKTFSGPLATTKAKTYFQANLPKEEPKPAAGAAPAAGATPAPAGK